MRRLSLSLLFMVLLNCLHIYSQTINRSEIPACSFAPSYLNFRNVLCSDLGCDQYAPEVMSYNCTCTFPTQCNFFATHGTPSMVNFGQVTLYTTVYQNKLYGEGLALCFRAIQDECYTLTFRYRGDSGGPQTKLHVAGVKQGNFIEPTTVNSDNCLHLIPSISQSQIEEFAVIDISQRPQGWIRFKFQVSANILANQANFTYTNLWFYSTTQDNQFLSWVQIQDIYITEDFYPLSILFNDPWANNAPAFEPWIATESIIFESPVSISSCIDLNGLLHQYISGGYVDASPRLNIGPFYAPQSLNRWVEFCIGQIDEPECGTREVYVTTEEYGDPVGIEGEYEAFLKGQAKSMHGLNNTVNSNWVEGIPLYIYDILGGIHLIIQYTPSNLLHVTERLDSGIYYGTQWLPDGAVTKALIR